MRPFAFIPIALLAVVGIAVMILSGQPTGSISVSAQNQAPLMSYDHVQVPFFQDWMGSPHADIASRSFTNWNSADPPVVPVTCAKCHASAGFHDFIGLDGSAAGVVDNPAAPGVIQCSTCHNDVTVAQTKVKMPSGVILGNLGREAVCMECHQGRQNAPTSSPPSSARTSPTTTASWRRKAS